ncbi:MAG TPA: vitamin K epoxide reductase family protein, partial [Acidimicrobiales bacterium]|nr:vitamin K epoxide reductase family protein [Acidimicrobiales bacterium]
QVGVQPLHGQVGEVAEDAGLVDASGEAYVIGSVPDAVLGLVSSGVTAALATMGTAERAREQPLIPLALAAKAVLDAGWAMVLTLEQATKHKRFCGFCLVAAAAMVAVVPQVAPEARLAWRHLRS